MSTFMFAGNDKPTTMRRPAVMEKTKGAVKKPVEAPAEKRASSAAGMAKPTPAYVTVPLPPPILEKLAEYLEEKPAPGPPYIEEGLVVRPSFLQNLQKEIMQTPPPGVKTSPGPHSPSGKPSVIKTPEGTAVIDYMRVQPPPILEKQTKGQKAVGGSQQTVIESTIYIPHVLEEWKILKPRILEELISPERGGTATPPPEPVVYAPPENLGGILVAEEVGVAREEARRRRPLYT